MKSYRKLIAAAVFTQLTVTAMAVDDAELAALKQQIQELSIKVQMLEHQQANDVAAAVAAPKITLGGGGFSFSSADSNFVAQIHGLAQLDIYADPTKSASGAQTWSVGLNWYLNKNIRANASYARTTFDGKLASGNVGYQPENVIFSRLQLAF
jgi:outer membrane murein-binding lipoprotein Lpp